MLLFSTLATTVQAMAKGEAKKSNVKEQAMSQPGANKKSIIMKKKSVKVTAQNAVPASPPAPSTKALSGPSQAVAFASATNGSGDALQGKEKAMNKPQRSSGFIFMCNTEMKPECFRYHVFGLPAGNKEVVEKIKEGTKLFLFDFNMKLLYGVYKATCQGQMNLEASAFGGKFPAQVKFSIYKDCIPLHESAFKSAIEDNYQGSKFESELSAKQVRRLIPLFRWSTAPTAPTMAPYLVRELPRPDQCHSHLVRPQVDPYLSQLQYSHHADAVPRVEPLLPHLAWPPPQVDPYLPQVQYSHHVDLVRRVEPPPPHLVRPLPEVDPYLLQLPYNHHVDAVPGVERPLPHLVRPPPQVDPYPPQLQYSHNVDVVPRVEPPLPHLERSPRQVDPYPRQLQYSHNVDVVPRVELPLSYLVRPPPQVDPYPSQLQYSHRVDVVPRAELPPPHLVRPPPQVDTYQPQFQYSSSHVDVVPRVEPPLPHLVRPPPQVDTDQPQLEYSHHVNVVPRVEPPLPYLVRPSPQVDSYPPQLQYSRHVDVVPRVEPSLPVLQHEFFGNASTMAIAQTMEHQGLPAHPSDRHYVVENRHPCVPEDPTQFVQDRYHRYEGVQEMVSCGVETMPHQSSLEGERGSDLQQATTTGYYNSYQTSAVPNNTYLATATSYQSFPSMESHDARTLIYPPVGVGSGRAEPLTTATRSVPMYNSYSSFQTSAVPNNAYPPTAASYQSYPSTASPHAQTLIYPPGGVESGRAEPPTTAARSFPISSYYCFHGAKEL